MQEQSSQLTFDAEFERGLESILRPMRERGASQGEIDAITKRAREFYQSQQRSSRSQDERVVDGQQDGAQDTVTDGYSGSTAAASTTPGHFSIAPALPEDDPPYPVTFDEIAEMIATGKPVPGIREIPTQINEAAPTEASIARQEGAGRKPWERTT